MTGPPGKASLLSARTRWQRLDQEPRRALLRVALLASYTIDPLAPYLGLALHDAGLPATLSVGPFNQIMQQCLDDHGKVAGLRPDVLIVLPRFEELAPDPLHHGGPAVYGQELLRLADAAVAAVGRWDACLVYVLPAIPESRPYGAADGLGVHGVVAAATAAREALRRRLAGVPNVHVADAEEAVRAVGSRHAYHPSLFRFARIPYTEEVFAYLGAHIGGLLRARYGVVCRMLMLDADSLLTVGAGLRLLERPLRELHETGVRLALYSAREPDETRGALAAALPGLPREWLQGRLAGARPLEEQLDALAAETGVGADRTSFVTTDPDRAEGMAGWPDGCAPVLLGRDPESWPGELRAAGVFDRMPDPHPSADGEPARGDPEPAAPAAPLSLEEFVASLEVSVTFEPVGTETLSAVAELVERAKDFTLGIRESEADIAGRDPAAGQVLAARVRDRFGDYGIGAAVGFTRNGSACTVDLFSVSCPVLGKGVEQAVVREVVDRADSDGRDMVVIRYRETEHNRVTTEFLAEVASGDWKATSGRRIRLLVDREARC